MYIYIFLIKIAKNNIQCNDFDNILKNHQLMKLRNSIFL